MKTIALLAPVVALLALARCGGGDELHGLAAAASGAGGERAAVAAVLSSTGSGGEDAGIVPFDAQPPPDPDAGTEPAETSDATTALCCQDGGEAEPPCPDGGAPNLGQDAEPHHCM